MPPTQTVLDKNTPNDLEIARQSLFVQTHLLG